MLRHTHWLLISAILGYVTSSRPAQAIDCAKAQNKIEIAICSDATLKQKDAELGKTYFELRRSLSAEQEVLLSDQRVWLKRRDQNCSGLDAAQLSQCVGSSIDERQKRLAYEWGLNAENQDPLKKMQVNVGSVTLLITSPTPGDYYGYSLSYKSETIASGSNSLWNEPPFVVKRRLSGGNGEAALLETHDGGEMNCSHYYVLWVDAHGDFHKQELGEHCLTPNADGHVIRTGQGFEFIRPASAASAGERLLWEWRAGLSRTQVAYTPTGGKSMSDLVTAGPKEFKEPLHNEEFYRAVLALPAQDRADFLVSLAGLHGGCDCAGPADYKLYGLRNTPVVYSMSGCGLYIEGHYLRCSGAEALAIWEKNSGKFYFAIVHNTHGEYGERKKADIHAFPALATWSNVARAQYDDWLNSSKWEKSK